MNMTGKANAAVAQITQHMKNGVDNCKLDGKIAEQQKRIKTLTREIGNLAIVRLEEGDEMSPEIMERYAAIKEAKKTITELEAERKHSRVVCPECGAKTSVEMTYCGVCGTKLKK